MTQSSPTPEEVRPTSPAECVDRAITAMVESEKTANAGMTSISHVGLAIAHGWVAVAMAMTHAVPQLITVENLAEVQPTELTEDQVRWPDNAVRAPAAWVQPPPMPASVAEEFLRSRSARFPDGAPAEDSRHGDLQQ